MRKTLKLSRAFLLLLVLIISYANPAWAVDSLSEAIAATDTAKLQALIANGADVTGEDGGRALYGAIQTNQYEMAKLLVSKGADVQFGERDNGFTPLHAVVAYISPITPSASNGLRQLPTGRMIVMKQDKPPMDAVSLKDKLALAELLMAHGADVNVGNKYGVTPLHQAGSTELAELLIKHGANVNAMHINNGTPLYAAITIGKSLVELLIAHGANVKNVDKSGYTPLHAALTSGRSDIARLLIAHGADVNVKDRNGLSLIENALQQRDTEFAAFLLANGAKTTTGRRSGITILEQAVDTGDVELVEAMLKNGDLTKAGSSPMFVAVARNLKDMVNLLIRYGADVNAGVKDGRPLLHTAPSKEILMLLLANGADANAKDRNGDTLLWSVCYDSVLTEVLLKHGANINIRNTHGRTVLHLASRYARTAVAQWLLEHGSDVNALDDSGQTPIFDAIKSFERHVATAPNSRSPIGISAGTSAAKRDELVQEATKATPANDLNMSFPAGFDTSNSRFTVELLMKHGAKLTLPDRQGQTLLYLAPSMEISDLLLKEGVDVNARRSDGATALHLAAASGKKDVVAVLLKHGADANAPMRDGITPLHYAKGAEVVRMLLAGGARAGAADNNGNTPLHFVNEALVVELLIAHGALVDEKNGSGQTPLMKSVRTLIGDFEDGRIFIGVDPIATRHRSSTEAVTALLDHGADASLKDNQRQAPVLYVRAAISESTVDEITDSLQELNRSLVAHGAQP